MRKLQRLVAGITDYIRLRRRKFWESAELLPRVFEELKKALPSRKVVKLNEPVYALIASDSDYHRTREGYMEYADVILTGISGVQWAIALGEAWGDYPAEYYDNDISAIRLGGKSAPGTRVPSEHGTGQPRTVLPKATLVQDASLSS